ncbi:MAG: hypothetical protein ACEPOZ_06475 [Marinifilaceae bacterium]
MGKYTLELSSTINIDVISQASSSVRWEEMAKKLEPERISINSFEEAQSICLDYIKYHNLGGGNWTGGQILDSSNNLVARIHYNGRIEILNQ